jgi:hypothetical protein
MRYVLPEDERCVLLRIKPTHVHEMGTEDLDRWNARPEAKS